jgi:hypothetical protein
MSQGMCFVVQKHKVFQLLVYAHAPSMLGFRVAYVKMFNNTMFFDDFKYNVSKTECFLMFPTVGLDDPCLHPQMAGWAVQSAPGPPGWLLGLLAGSWASWLAPAHPGWLLAMDWHTSSVSTV